MKIAKEEVHLIGLITNTIWLYHDIRSKY
jgi:hypothetical protein